MQSLVRGALQVLCVNEALKMGKGKIGECALSPRRRQLLAPTRTRIPAHDVWWAWWYDLLYGPGPQLRNHVPQARAPELLSLHGTIPAGAQCAHAAVGVVERYKAKEQLVFKQWSYFGQAKIALKIQDDVEMVRGDGREGDGARCARRRDGTCPGWWQRVRVPVPVTPQLPLS
jgi:hypothetical protein